MPTGPLRGPRPLANSRLLVTVNYGPRVPFTRDEAFDDAYFGRLSSVLSDIGGETDFGFMSRGLSPEQVSIGPMGERREEAGTIEIVFEEPPSIEFDNFEMLMSELKDIVPRALRRAKLDIDVEPRPEVNLLTMVEGPMGRDRPFATSSFVFVALYTRHPQDGELQFERKAEAEMRDVVVQENIQFGRADVDTIEIVDSEGVPRTQLVVRSRGDVINANKIRPIYRTLREVGNDSDMNLDRMDIVANGKTGHFTPQGANTV